MDNLLEQLLNNMRRPLPGLTAHHEMSPLKRPSGDFTERAQARSSAVAVVISEFSKVPSIILTQRHEYDGAHSGQISFPGGKKEENDPNLEFTARRECMEEIGIDLASASLIGSLTEVYIPVSKFIVQPYLYLKEDQIELNLNEREVREIIHFPVHELLSHENRSTMDVRSREGVIYRNIPCFKTGNKEIWGATALILNELRILLSF
jgi:8-oxo-dGTP pyrophosphatase MutT (NUDIX family)